MKNFFKKQRELIAILVYVAFVGALVYFLVMPLLASIGSVNDQIQEGSLKQEFVKKQLADLPKFRQQYEMLGKSENLADVLLDKDEAVTLIERLEKLADDSNNKITISVTGSAPVQKAAASSGKAKGGEPTLVDSLPSADYLQMRLSLTGNYGTIYDFINSLENFEYYSDIVAIQIGQNAAKNSPGANSGLFVQSDQNPLSGSKKTDSNIGPNDLTASLDVVFYTKKQ